MAEGLDVIDVPVEDKLYEIFDYIIFIINYIMKITKKTQKNMIKNIKILIVLYLIYSLFLLIEFKYTKSSADLQKDGFTILGNINNKDALSLLPDGYEFIDYKYSIQGCSLSTFHRDVTSLARYLNTGPHLSACPGSHKTVPFLFSNPYTVSGKKGDCYLFNCDLVHAGALHNFNNKRYMEQFKIAHIDDISSIKKQYGKCKNNCVPEDLHNNYTKKKGNCNINKTYEIVVRKASLHLSFIGNHIFTEYLQKNQNSFVNNIMLLLNGGRAFYNGKSM